MPGAIIDQLVTGLVALDQINETTAIPAARTCEECRGAFLVLTRSGLVTPGTDEGCPSCHPRWAGEGGDVGVTEGQVRDHVADCRGMSKVVNLLVREHDIDPALARARLREMERDPRFQQIAADVRHVCPDRVRAWLSTFRLYLEGPSVAAHDEVAAAAVRRTQRMELDPAEVQRVVCRHGGKVVCDGSVTEVSAKMLDLIRAHGRKLRVTCYMKSGEVLRYRGNGDRII